MNPPRIYSKRPGFTFLELLLVILIMGVVIGLAVPGFKKTYEKFLLNQTTRDLASIMHYSQTRAVMTGCTHRLKFSPDFIKYRVKQGRCSDQAKNVSAEETGLPGRWGRIFSIPRKVKVVSSQETVVFYPDGNIGKVEIRISDKADSFTISTQKQNGYVVVSSQEHR